MPSTTPAAPLAWGPKEVSAGHQEGFPWPLPGEGRPGTPHRAVESTNQPVRQASSLPILEHPRLAKRPPIAPGTSYFGLPGRVPNREPAMRMSGAESRLPRRNEAGKTPHPLAGRRQREKTREELRENSGPLSYRYKSAVIS